MSSHCAEQQSLRQGLTVFRASWCSVRSTKKRGTRGTLLYSRSTPLSWVFRAVLHQRLWHGVTPGMQRTFGCLCHFTSVRGGLVRSWVSLASSACVWILFYGRVGFGSSERHGAHVPA